MTPGSSVSSLLGSLELAQFDAKALDRFDLSAAGFWRSFSVVLLSVPVYLLVLYLINTAAFRYQKVPQSYEIELIAYMTKWTVFVCLMLPITKLLDAGDRFYRVITVYNWCNPLARAFFLPAYAACAAGLASLDTLKTLIALSYLICGIYLGYVLRVTLKSSYGAVIAILLLDFFLERATRAYFITWIAG